MDSQIYKQLYLAFQHIDYYDDVHKYYIGDQELISMTTLIKKFEHNFRREYWLKYKSLEAEGYTVKSDATNYVPADHIMVNDILYHYSTIKVDTTDLAALWDEKSRAGLTYGTKMHRYMELAYFGKYESERIDACDKLVSDHKHLIPIALEFVVGGLEEGVAGQFDGLFYNTKTDGIELHDYKVDEEIDFSNRFQKLKKPLDHLDQCKANKYRIQLNGYAYLIEKYTDIKIDKLIIQNFQKDSYVSYEMEKDTKLAESMIKAYNGTDDQQRVKYSTEYYKTGF